MDIIAQTGAGRLVERYTVDTLGAPFEVTLLDSVTVSVDPLTGKEMVEIPDLCGLMKTIVRSRVAEMRKLSGEELRFIRRALGFKAKEVADFLEIAPEHWSRCEAGTKVLSGSSEKLFRMYAFVASNRKDPGAFLKGEILPPKTSSKDRAKFDKLMQDFVGIFINLKLEAVYDSATPLHFEFVRRGSAAKPSNDDKPSAIDDGEWTKDAA